MRPGAVRQGPVGQGNPEDDDRHDGDDYGGKGLHIALGGNVAEDDVDHVVLAVHEEDQHHVDQDERGH